MKYLKSLNHRHIIFQPLNLVLLAFNHRVKPLNLLLLRTYANQTTTPIVHPTNKILIKKQTEYKQLPEDSQYIEKFYSELKSFEKEIKLNKDIPFINFTDFEKDLNALIHHLEQFIQTKIYNELSTETEDGILVANRYKEFLNNFKITLVLNGGHTHIFDILLQNKNLFESFELSKKQISRDSKRKDNDRSGNEKDGKI